MILIEVELAGHMTRFAVPVPRVPVVGDRIQLFRDDYPADVEQVVLYTSIDAGYPVARVVVRTQEGSINWREERLWCAGRVPPPPDQDPSDSPLMAMYRRQWGDVEAERLKFAVHRVIEGTLIARVSLENVAIDHGPTVVPHLRTIVDMAKLGNISIADAAAELLGAPS